MNNDWVEAFDLATAIKKEASEIKEVEKIIFPPFPYLQMISVIMDNATGFYVGAQNCSEHEKGAFTGEVSAAMIQSSGARYVLVGHSERRQYFNESPEQLIKKIELALKSNLTVIYCFGEVLEERRSGKHKQVVEEQLREVLTHFPVGKADSLVLAYEPVWAIGTGETASPDQAQEMHKHVRECVAGIFSAEVASKIPILYGGSCNPQNAKEIFQGADVDGGLIGGASLKASDFCQIMRSFS